jgi:hypothetical protein
LEIAAEIALANPADIVSIRGTETIWVSDDR